jgi:chemotaxis protein CheX
MNSVNPNLAANEDRRCWGQLLGMATQEVFDLMLGSRTSATVEPFAEEELDITSMVGVAGKMCGLITLRCAAQSAGLMASKMLGTDAQTGAETWDAVGEICNMIAGSFKNKVAGMGEGCMLSVPTVITGEGYNLHALADSERIETRLLFEGFPLIVSLEVQS